MTKQEAHDILTGATQATLAQQQQANAVYYGTGGYYEQDAHAESAWLPPANPVYGPPTAIALIDLPSPDPTNSDFLLKLEYNGYTSTINGNNNSSYGAYALTYTNWRKIYVSGPGITLPPPQPHYATPISYDEFAADMHASWQNGSFLPIGGMHSAPVANPFDFTSSAMQKIMALSAPSSAMAALLRANTIPTPTPA